MSASASQTGCSRAEPEEVSALRASPPRAWRAGSFRVGGGSRVGWRMAGWIYGPLGIDRRDDGWAITHIPTGYSVGGVSGPIKEAARFVEALVSGVDWEFTDPEAARGLLKTIKHVEIETGVERTSLWKVGAFQGFPPKGTQ